MSTCRKPDWADDVANVRHPVKFAPVDPHFDRPTRDSLHQGDGAGDGAGDAAGDAAGRVVRETRRGTGRADLGNREEQRSGGESGQRCLHGARPLCGGEASPLQRPSEHLGYVKVSTGAPSPLRVGRALRVASVFHPEGWGRPRRHGYRMYGTAFAPRPDGYPDAAHGPWRRRLDGLPAPGAAAHSTIRTVRMSPGLGHDATKSSVPMDAEGQGFESPQLHPSLQHTGSPAPAAAVHLRGRRSR